MRDAYERIISTINKKALKLGITISILISNISIPITSFANEDVEVNEKVQAVYKAAMDKVEMYRNFNLLLIGLVAAMVVIAIVIRIYTDKEIMIRRIMDRRYEGVTEKEEAEEILNTQDKEDIRDKELGTQGVSKVDTQDTIDTTKVVKDKDRDTAKIVHKTTETKSRTDDVEDTSDDLKLEQVKLNYVPKTPKADTKSTTSAAKPNVSSVVGLDDEIELIKQAALEAKQEISKGNTDSVNKIEDVIIEGEQLNLKPSEIDIDYVPKINEELLEKEIGADLEPDMLDDKTDTSDDITDKEEINIWADDEPFNEYEFIDQGSYVYRADRPRLYPRVLSSDEVEEVQKVRKISRKERKRNQRAAARNAVRQSDLAAKQSKELPRQVKDKPKAVTEESQLDTDMSEAERKAAELEQRYSEQDFG